MDLEKKVELECIAVYRVSSIKYDYLTGKLSLIVDYSSDMEGIPCNLTVSFDPIIITSDNITIYFDAVSETLPLVITQHLQ